MPELKKKIEELEVDKYFNFVPRKPAEEIPQYLAWADGLLITLSKSEVFSITIPAKTQSCLACGKPILVSADGEVQAIIKEAGAGLVSNAEDVEGLVNSILTFIDLSQREREEMGQRALKYSKNHFSKEKLLNRMDELFKEEI